MYIFTVHDNLLRKHSGYTVEENSYPIHIFPVSELKHVEAVHI